MDQLINIAKDFSEQLNQLVIIIKGNNIPSWLTAVGTLGATIIALLTALGILQRFAPLNLKIFSGDKLELAISSNTKIRKVHLLTTFSNLGLRAAEIRKVILTMSGSDDYILDWNLFVKPNLYKGIYKIPLRRPSPFIVPQLSNQSYDIQFFSNKEIKLHKGKYKCEIRVWANVDKLTSEATHVYKFITIVEQNNLDAIKKEIEEIKKDKKPKVRMISLSIEEWTLKSGQLKNRKNQLT